MMSLVRAKYDTERGLRRGDKTHINDKGLPLCRVAYRRGFCTDSVPCQWISETGIEPTCPVCAAKMRKIGGAA